MRPVCPLGSMPEDRLDQLDLKQVVQEFISKNERPNPLAFTETTHPPLSCCLITCHVGHMLDTQEKLYKWFTQQVMYNHDEEEEENKSTRTNEKKDAVKLIKRLPAAGKKNCQMFSHYLNML